MGKRYTRGVIHCGLRALTTKNAEQILGPIMQQDRETVKRRMNMRGVSIDEPMSARDIAARTGISQSYVYRLSRRGALQAVIDPRGGKKRYVGVVPVCQQSWLKDIRDILKQNGHAHMTGMNSARTVMVRYNNECKVIDYSVYRDQIETDLDRLRGWLGVDKASPSVTA